MAVLSRQALREPETFEAWLEALRRATAALPDGDLPACPYCGRFDLTLRFVADPGTRIGYAALWSEFCGHGLRASRVAVPDGTPFLATQAPPSELAAYIPRFTEIGPSGLVSESAFSDPLSDRATAVVRLLSRRGPMTASQIAAEFAVSRDVVASRLDELMRRKLVAHAGDREAPTGIEPVYTALQAAA